MVTIINYVARQNEAGKDFFVLELQGGVELVKSVSTGKVYATARKATISCTFNETMCKSLIGSKFPGKIVKQECEAYEYKVPNSDETIMLEHIYAYVAEGDTIEENVFEEVIN